ERHRNLAGDHTQQDGRPAARLGLFAYRKDPRRAHEVVRATGHPRRRRPRWGPGPQHHLLVTARHLLHASRCSPPPGPAFPPPRPDPDCLRPYLRAGNLRPAFARPEREPALGRHVRIVRRGDAGLCPPREAAWIATRLLN